MKTRAAIPFIMLVSVLALSGPAALAQINYAPTEENLRTLAKNDGDVDVVQQLLNQGVNPNATDWQGRTAVHAAATAGAVQNLDALLQGGGDPNVQDQDGNTPLHLAAHGLSGGITPRVVTLLLRAGADPNLANAEGKTPLHAAVGPFGAQTPEVVGALLEAGATVQAVMGNGLTPLQLFVTYGPNEGRVVELLLDAGADPDRKTPGGDAPLHVAIKEGGSYGKTAVVAALLAGNADPCVRDGAQYTPYQISYEQEAVHQSLDRAHGYDLACDDRRKETETAETASAGADPWADDSSGPEDVWGQPAAEADPWGQEETAWDQAEEYDEDDLREEFAEDEEVNADYNAALAELEAQEAERRRRAELARREAEERHQAELARREAEERHRAELARREAEERHQAELARREAEAEEREWQEMQRERQERERREEEMAATERAEYWREITQGMNQILERAVQQRQNQGSSGGQGSTGRSCGGRTQVSC